jgi:hypothetical protein
LNHCEGEKPGGFRSNFSGMVSAILPKPVVRGPTLALRLGFRAYRFGVNALGRMAFRWWGLKFGV